MAKPSLFRTAKTAKLTETSRAENLNMDSVKSDTVPTVVESENVSTETALEVFQGSNLPAPLAVDGVGDVEISASAAYGPYVGFSHPMSPRYGEIIQSMPGIKDGEAFLIRPDQPMIRLNPFKVHLIAAKQLWGRFDNEGQPYDVSTEKPQGRDRTIKEFFESVLLIYLPNGEIAAARCRMKAGQTRAIHTLAAELKRASSPDWGKLSQSHATSLQAPRPYLRFYGIISCGQKVAKDSGFKYHVATATTHPAGPTEWLALGKYFRDNQSEFDAVWNAYQDTLFELGVTAPAE